MVDFWLVDLFTFFTEWHWYSWFLLPIVVVGFLLVILHFIK